MPTLKNNVIQQLRKTLLLQDAGQLTDGQLLECFVSRREEAALEALVQRHARMVWGVCRRLLSNQHDVEDAFQTTFLVLVRKAESIVPRERVGSWLYGVACRTARKARATAAKQRTRERQAVDLPEPAAKEQDLGCELQAVLDQELSRLPEKYRVAILLCDLQGKTRKEAARQLGVPEGTLAAQVARARTMLAKRLARRGLALSGATLAGMLPQQSASAHVPPSLLSTTIKAAALAAAGLPAAGLVSARVAALTEGVMKSMMLAKVKIAVRVGVLLVFLTGITGAVVVLGQDRPEPSKQTAAPDRDAKTEGKTAAPDRPSKTADERMALLRARATLAEKAYRAELEGLTHTRRFGNTLIPDTRGPEEVYIWSVRWLKAQQELSSKDEDEGAALEDHLKRMAKLKEAVKQLTRDLMPNFKADEAEWYRLEAEIWLAQAKAGKIHSGSR